MTHPPSSSQRDQSESPQGTHEPQSRGDDPTVHFIRDGRFVCLAEPTAKCRNYPGCECEAWDPELHGDSPAEGHADQPQDECWIAPWLNATDLSDSYGPDELLLGDDEFPDGPVAVEWHFDYLTWEYADDTDPTDEDDEEFCPGCFAGLESSEHHAECVAPLDQIEEG